MKALMMTKYGDVSSSLEFQTVSNPKIEGNQILIKTQAASINPIDYKVLRGDLKALVKLTFPLGIGRDVSGVIAEVGSNVKNLKVGDEVFARVDEQFAGTIAEYTVSDASHVNKKPDSLTHEQAASIPLAGLTAYQALVGLAKIQANEKVFIHAGSGGVGTLAIQIAKNKGAYVATTTSTKNIELVRNLGADKIIDYKTQNYLNELNDYDVVFDTLGGDYTADAFKILKTGGRVVSIAGELDEQAAKELGLNFFIRALLSLKARKIIKAANLKKATYRFLLMRPNGEQLSELASLVNSEQVKPVIDSVYSFEESIKALDYLTKGRARGKVVIKFG